MAFVSTRTCRNTSLTSQFARLLFKKNSIENIIFHILESQRWYDNRLYCRTKLLNRACRQYHELFLSQINSKFQLKDKEVRRTCCFQLRPPFVQNFAVSSLDFLKREKTHSRAFECQRMDGNARIVFSPLSH
jgi:hypothetical protein